MTEENHSRGGHDRSDGRRPAGHNGSSLMDLLAALIAWARRCLAEFGASAQRVAAPDRVLTYRETVRYLVENRPPGQVAVRGALLRRRQTGAWLFQLMFLNESNDPVADPVTGRTLGRTILARGCDEELTEMFGDRDLILFN